MTDTKKLQIWFPLLFSVVLLAGIVLGYNLGMRSGIMAGPRGNTLQKALSLIRTHYVDSLNMDTIEGKAIQDIMNELDPHSVYFPPQDLQAVNDDLAGKFEGIGVEFNIFSDTINVVYVFPGGPSEKAGLQIGDRIIRVNDSVLAGKKMDVEAIKKSIRGESGSTVKIGLLRNGKPMDINITRGSIPVKSVDAAYMIDKTTGYLKLSKFTESSYEEFMAAMEDLKKQGLKTLIFDLRGNGGGYMNEAVDMADEFLDGDKLIVYTQGVNSPKQEYRCKRPGLFETGKLFVLVDELTASASEVLSGALQDWCRATIIGRRTFGKGLVQQQFDLGGDGALRLTVARYYTPMGRSIQRSYEAGKKVYMDELWERYSHGDLISADSNKITGKAFLTSCRDTVYGGGGIMPSVFVPLDTSLIQQRLNHMYGGNGLNNAVYNYYLSHKTEIDHYTSAADYYQHFAGDEQIWQNLVAAQAADSVDYSKLTAEEKTAMQLRLKALLARFRWRNNGFFEVLNSKDPVILKTLSLIK